MKLTRLFFGKGFWILTAALAVPAAGRAAPRPNVLLIMPDDLSFGDFSYYHPDGPRTPNIDRLARDSVRLTDFHVSPTCSPTRAALMTGRYNDATGVWHTVQGREWLRADETTMADIFRANGYFTALIGKWHLGDDYPLRAQDRGFDYTAMIRGGGIDQQPDYWGNTNNAPSTMFVDGRPVPLLDEHDGIPGAFSTNFSTDRAIERMTDCVAHGTPFFLYLPYNVAHDPPDMPPDARAGVDAQTATIENLDKNVGRLLKFLRTSQLEDGTILIFLTDNGMKNDLFRSGKSSPYEGGHRVPFFIRWKNGGMGGDSSGGWEQPRLAAHIDLLPTLMELLGLHDVAHRSPSTPIQGRSLRTLLDRDPANDDPGLWNRSLVVDNQRREQLSKTRPNCVMRDETDATGRILHKWRLVSDPVAGVAELYDVQSDPQERMDLSRQPEHSALLASLRAAFENWWPEVSARRQEYCRVIVGTAAEPRTCLYSHDWHTVNGTPVPWNQGQIAAGMGGNGFNAVEFARAGTWRFELHRWPEEIAGETNLTSALRTPIAHGFPDRNRPTGGAAIPIRSARIVVSNGGKIFADVRKEADPAADCVSFELPHLPAGPAMVQTWFYRASGDALGGAYYNYVEYLRP